MANEFKSFDELVSRDRKIGLLRTDIEETKDRLRSRIVKLGGCIEREAKMRVEDVKDTLRPETQLKRRPLVSTGLAIGAGILLGSALRSTAGKYGNTNASSPSGFSVVRSNHYTRPSLTTRLSTELEGVRGIAIGALVGVLQNLAMKNLPLNVGKSISEAVGQISRGFGAQVPSPTGTFQGNSYQGRYRPSQDSSSANDLGNTNEIRDADDARVH